MSPKANARAQRNFVYRCESLAEVRNGVEALQKDLDVQSGEMLWFRGCDRPYPLLPSLMRDTQGLTDDDHNQAEQDLFFEFQARAHELRRMALSDWEVLFYGRHYGLPTRVLDWSDTLGIALYFATESCRSDADSEPVVWAINPLALNAHKTSFGEREVLLPTSLVEFDDGDYPDLGDILMSEGDWPWDTACAIYPIQINERVRAQRGWFTIHGNNRAPLEQQVPSLVGRLDIAPSAVSEIMELLNTAGLNRFSIYPDLENLAGWLRGKNLNWASERRAAKSPPAAGKRPKRV